MRALYVALEPLAVVKQTEIAHTRSTMKLAKKEPNAESVLEIIASHTMRAAENCVFDSLEFATSYMKHFSSGSLLFPAQPLGTVLLCWN